MIDLVERVLKYVESMADYSEVRYENATGNRFIIKNGILEATDISKTFGISIRYLKKGFLGTIYSNKLEFASIKTLIDKIIKNASAKGLKTSVRLSEEKAYTDNYEVKQKINLKNVSQEEKIKAVLEIEKALSDKKLAMRYFELYDEFKEKIYVNSEGSKIISKIPRLGLDYALTFIANNDSEQRSFQYGASGGWELFKNWNLLETL
jgi:predicted Zn-dependent protease